MKMQLRPVYIALFAALSLAAVVRGQTLDRLVSIRCQDKELGQVLDDLERDYEVYFTYSSYHVPIEKAVTLHVARIPLRKALDTLLFDTEIVFMDVDGQVVLHPDPNKELLTLVDPLLSGKDGPVVPLVDPELARQRQKWKDRMADLGNIRMELPGGDRAGDVDLEAFRLMMEEVFREQEPEMPVPVFSDHQLAQVSLLPFLGTNAYRSNEVTNNFSLNVFWGTNGGVDGVEVGGFVNTVINDVKGIQVAGLGNTVGGNVTGTQLAGLFNVNQETTMGAQAAGLFNMTHNAQAAQIAGVFNLNTQDFSGMQLAGLFNYSAGKAEAFQLAGLFNAAGESTKTQISGLFNHARDVSGTQISGLLNIGRKVRGAQIGLINVSDSISGMPIGLINIVKKGYNRVELAGSETLFANLGFKFGARSFYNVFHFGGRWDRIDRQINENMTRQGVYLSWGLGYGLGSVVYFNPRTAMNFELLAIHINELEEWTHELNLLNQFRMTLDLRLGQGRSSFFLGPVANLMISKRSDPDTGVIGSNIPPYVLYEDTVGNTNYKFWVGGYAGFRF